MIRAIVVGEGSSVEDRRVNMDRHELQVLYQLRDLTRGFSGMPRKLCSIFQRIVKEVVAGG